MKFWFGSLFCWLVFGPAVGSGVAAAAGPWVMICSGCLPVMAVVGRFFSGFFPVVAGVAAPVWFGRTSSSSGGVTSEEGSSIGWL
ncbi:hypothetical protein LOK49_LG10G01670 [Camellia lanceoleosa]|uniref:Uncharacterized protein n=1 Tax=Camellia lanceoleosa TaxID=1840588 RepID=A0ACC0G826_9ERIC|nr:hypothetical protein LOK49_LG10G01670 [Camellia lanceoleosa]